MFELVKVQHFALNLDIYLCAIEHCSDRSMVCLVGRNNI